MIRVIFLAGVAGTGFLAYKNWPDIRRYLRMRAM